MSERIKIFNGQIIHQNRMQSGGCLLVENGKIINVSASDVDFPDAELIDAKGNFISPGFIDIHIHGGGGSDFMDGTVEGFLQTTKTQRREE